MTEETDKTLDTIIFPHKREQALAIIASQHAAEVTSAVAEKLVGAEQWSSQLQNFHQQLRESIYGFLNNPEKK